MGTAASKTCDICVNGSGINYCEQCEVFFCYKCEESHLRKPENSDHQCIRGPNINAEVRQNCGENKIENYVKTKIDSLQYILKEIDTAEHNYQSEVKQIIQAIKNEGRRFKELIDEQVKSLIEDLKREEVNKLHHFQLMINEYQTALSRARNMQKMYKDTQTITETANLHQKLKQLMSIINATEDHHLPEIPSVQYTAKNVTQSEIEDMFGKLTLE